MPDLEGGEETPPTPADPQNSSLWARLTAWWSVRTYRFAVQFGAFLLAIALSYPALRSEFRPTLRGLEALTATIVSSLLGLFSSEAVLRGKTVVSLGAFSVTIIDECAGIYEVLIFSAAVLAYPTTWRNTFTGLAMGIPMLYAMNVLRIAALLVAGRVHAPTFEFMHIYFWQVTMLVMIGATWLLWLTWVVRGEEATPPTR